MPRRQHATSQTRLPGFVLAGRFRDTAELSTGVDSAACRGACMCVCTGGGEGVHSWIDMPLRRRPRGCRRWAVVCSHSSLALLESPQSAPCLAAAAPCAVHAQVRSKIYLCLTRFAALAQQTFKSSCLPASISLSVSLSCFSCSRCSCSFFARSAAAAFSASTRIRICACTYPGECPSCVTIPYFK